MAAGGRRGRLCRRLVFQLAAAVLIGGFLVGGLLRVDIRTDLDSFLPADDPAVTALERMSESFGSDPVVVLVRSERPGELLRSKQLLPLLGLEGKLSKLPDVAAVYGPGTVLNRIAGQAQDLLAELSGRRDSIKDPAARRSFDARYGSLLVRALPAGLPTLHNDRFASAVFLDAKGNPKPQWRFVVPASDAVAVVVRPSRTLDEAGMAELTAAVRHTVDNAKLDASSVQVTGVPVLIAAMGEQVRAEIPLLGLIALGAVLVCFLLAPWTRWRQRAVPLACTLLAAGLTAALFGWLGKPLSLGALGFLCVLLGVGSYYPTYIAQRADRRTVVALVSATAASFAALGLSPLPFVRDFGLAMAVGVLIAAATGYVVLGRRRREAADDRTATTVPPRRGSAIAALAGAVVVAGAGWAALPSVPVEGSVDKLAAGLPAMTQAREVESVLGAAGELRIVLSGPNVLTPAAVGWARRAQDVAVARHGDQLRLVASPASMLTFLGPEPTAEQIKTGVRLMPRYLSSTVFRGDNRTSVITFGVRLTDVDELRRLHAGLHRDLPPPPQGFRVEITGLPVVAVTTNDLISGEKVLSNLSGIAAAGLVLFVGLRRRRDAARAVLAAALATGAMLALLSLAGIALSPLTAALGSLTAAVGCEFTVLLAQARRSANRALSRSVLLAAASSAAGYAALGVSSLSMVAQFGVLLAMSVGVALIAAWLVVWTTGDRAPRGPEDGESEVKEPLLVGVGR